MNLDRHNEPDDNYGPDLPDDLNDDIEKYRQSEEQKFSLSESEIENALDNVLGQIDADSGEEKKTISDKGFHFDRKLMSIAASITFIGLLTILSFPKNIAVPNGEIAVVTLPDGSNITLNSGSEISYSRYFNYLGREVTLTGEGYFEVESDPDNPFQVNTPNSTVQVLGTKFNLVDWNDSRGLKSELTVTEGKVKYKSKTQEHNIILTENKGAAITDDYEIITIDIEPDKKLAWLSNNIAFQNESIVLAFGKLERRFDISIELSESLLSERENITAFYHSPENAESIIQDICTIKGLSYQKTHKGYKITLN